MGEHTIELVYFDGCPNAEQARTNLRDVTSADDSEAPWREWNLSDEDTPERFRRFGSPTVLVDGEDVTGADGGNAAMACRADGAPSTAAIREALLRPSPRGSYASAPRATAPPSPRRSGR